MQEHHWLWQTPVCRSHLEAMDLRLIERMRNPPEGVSVSIPGG